MYDNLSLRLSHVLEKFGYGAQQRQFRRESYRAMGKIFNNFLSESRMLLVGSKGEGLTNMYESDVDTLISHITILCTEQGFEGLALSHQTVLTYIPHYSYHSHMFLQLERFASGKLPQVGNSFCTIAENIYLSSAALSDHFLAQSKLCGKDLDLIQVHDIVGPSVNMTIKGFNSDFVHVIPCLCPSILQAWASRPRPHNWPSPELIDQVISMGAVAAPTAHDVSVCKQLEWRICFNEGETLLVSSMKDTLCKVFVLLKIMKKDVLKPPHKEVTSYMLKNIVFWLAELNPPELFTVDSLYDWLLKALEYLKQAIKQGYLPYYMIPERNLLAGKMLPDQREEMLDRLEQTLAAGLSMLLMCEKITCALTIMSPQRLQVSILRNEMEMAWLSTYKYLESGVNRDNNILIYLFIQHVMVLPDIHEIGIDAVIPTFAARMQALFM